jgi:signal transduction histidine kinase
MTDSPADPTWQSASEKLQFLAEASMALAGSLDYEKTLETVARLALSCFGDWCFVHRIVDGSLRTAEVAVREPATLSRVERLAQLLSEVDAKHASHAIVLAMRTGQPQVRHRMELAAYRRVTGNAELIELLDTLRPLSVLVVPFSARGRRLGTITFASISQPALYGPNEVKLAQDLALRAGMAVDSAELYRDARQAIALRDEFLSIASHELKTPLTAMKMQTQMRLRRVERGDAPASERLAEMFAADNLQLDRLARLIDDMLDISRMRAGKVDLHRTVADLAACTREVVARFQPHIAATQSLVVVEAPEPVVGEWDINRLEQVIGNLLSNALKYGQGNPVHLVVHRVGERARLVVRDQGIGIAPEDHARIFACFERAVVARSISGFGLGLHIVQHIINAHHGTVRVDSAPAAGATFTVELPLLGDPLV